MYIPGELNRATIPPDLQDEFAKRAQPVQPEMPFEPDVVPKAYVLLGAQKESMDELVEFCLGNRGRMILLEGYAGTGKTFTLNRAVEEVKRRASWVNFGVTAPTHKAVRILKKLSDIKNLLDFGTIHSFLALKQDIDGEGKVTYKPDYTNKYERKIDGLNVLIVDETSMLDDELFGYLLDEMRSNSNLRIIFTGDSVQINPVMGQEDKRKRGHLVSLPFIKERQVSHKIQVLILTEPQRQAAESPIILYAHAIRQQIKNQTIDFEFKEEYKPHLEVLPRDWNVVGPLLEHYFSAPEFQEDSDYVKVIAWRNIKVNWFNDAIRKMIYKQESLPKLMAGEKVILDQPFIKGKKLVLPNNEEVVIKFHPEGPTMNYALHYKLPAKVFTKNPFDINKKQESILKVYNCILVTEEGYEYAAMILHESSEQEYNRVREAIKLAAKQSTDQFERKELWQEFYGIADKFVWVKYNYCLTGHKSQGSSYNYCFSVEQDIMVNRDYEERNRIAYVAVTRAREKAFIIK